MFGYLKRTASDGIIFGLDDQLVFYGTSDAAHNVLQQVPGWPATQGITGYHFQLFGGPVAWRSSSQKLTSHSSTESELYALDEATRELGSFRVPPQRTLSTLRLRPHQPQLQQRPAQIK